jgi:hypothetical protein
MSHKITTLHPDPHKRGVNISAARYEQVRAVILDILQQQGEMTFEALAETVEARLTGQFDGAIRWYYTTVKLDLEARRIIERLPGSKPQRIRLVDN